MVTSVQYGVRFYYGGFPVHIGRSWTHKIQKFARFFWFRQGYSYLKRYQQTSKLDVGAKRSKFFPEVDVDRCIQDLQQQSLACDFQLSPAVIGEILLFAKTQSCFEPDFNSGSFRLQEIKEGRLPRDGNRPVYCALVEHLERCNAIVELANDPVLLGIAQRHLKYYPETVTTHLTWSIASDRPLEVSQANYPPSNFHYDIAGFNFMTMNFYITPVHNVDDGPHMMIEGTHRKKPWSFFLSGRHSDEKIERHFGLENVRTILGPAGYGFMEDPSCIHRVLPPTQEHRLIFQIRYS